MRYEGFDAAILALTKQSNRNNVKCMNKGSKGK
jgi:hypothetical protein